MPTIIALDVSLSMQRNIHKDNSLTYHQLAVKGISQLLEHFHSNSVEFTSFVTFSTVTEIKVDFTRDYDQVRQALKKVEPGDKLCLISMLKSVAGILSSNWGGCGGAQNYCQVVVFTDCGLGFGSTALSGFLDAYDGKEEEPEYAWIAALKPVKLNFICMGIHSDDYFKSAHPLYQQLLDLTGLKGQLYMTRPPKEQVDETSENSNSEANSQTASTTGATGSTHKSELGRTAMHELIERLCETSFKPYEVILKCGGYFRLECPVHIWPAPVPYENPDFIGGGGGGGDSPPMSITIAPTLEVCGYLSLSDIGSPASLSRHLIIPKVEREKSSSRRSSDKSSSNAAKTGLGAGTGGSGGSISAISANPKHVSALDVNHPNYEFEKLELDIREFYTKEAKEAEESGDEANANKSTSGSTGGGSSGVSGGAHSEIQTKESMCVLLHGALKVENLAALVLLNTNWYGFLYSYADSKKKSNLMLNILPPGNNVIPWLGDLQLLGFADEQLPGETCAFPVKAEKRSYAQSCVVWIRHVSLQSDVQKVLRHAKKMPEKTQHFYKELNRIRRAALSIGFVELLEAMATLFEKESAQLALIGSNVESSMQLQHAAMELRKPANRDLKVSIGPAQKFGVGGSGSAGGGGGIIGNEMGAALGGYIH